jgi:hypothetical protein
VACRDHTTIRDRTDWSPHGLVAARIGRRTDSVGRRTRRPYGGLFYCKGDRRLPIVGSWRAATTQQSATVRIGRRTDWSPPEILNSQFSILNSIKY